MGIGEWTEPTRISIVLRLIAFAMLQPGMILARAMIDKFFWEALGPDEFFRYASLGGVMLNAIFAIWLYQFIDALRPKRTN